MKYLKRFENFGRFESEGHDSDLENDFENHDFDDFNDESCEICGINDCDCNYDNNIDDFENDEESDESNRERRWGDEEIVENKRFRFR